MNEGFAAALHTAWSLVVGFDARLAQIVRLRLAWPSEILCVTFTNRAAREMKERVGHLIGPAAEGVVISWAIR